MEKEFVPYGLAVRLKALDYDEPCFATWNGETLDASLQVPSDDYFTKAPTFSQAFRWFREKHGFPSYVDMDDYSYYRFTIYKGIAISEAPHETYEEAELACLERLIETVEAKTK